MQAPDRPAIWNNKIDCIRAESVEVEIEIARHGDCCIVVGSGNRAFIEGWAHDAVLLPADDA